MTIQRLFIDTDLTTDGFKSQCDLSMGGLDAANNFANYVVALIGGNQMADLDFNVGMAKAAGTFTFASVIATDVFAINGVDFTCVASGATGNQFNVGGDDEESAANAAAAVNASATALAQQVVATSEGAVITVTAVLPGTTGNAITITAADATITPSGARLTGGSDGTAYSINLS